VKRFLHTQAFWRILFHPRAHNTFGGSTSKTGLAVTKQFVSYGIVMPLAFGKFYPHKLYCLTPKLSYMRSTFILHAFLITGPKRGNN